MSILSTIENDVKNDLNAAAAKAAEIGDHIKSILETHLPSVTADVQKFENEPFVKQYLASNLAVPEHLVNIGLDFLGKLVTAWNGQQPAADENAPVGLDAQPDVAA